MTKANEAAANLNSGFNCAQAVLSTYCEQLGLDKETALKLSSGFGGGMGKQGHVCGAVTGAYLVIGLKCGQYLPGDKKAREETYGLINEFAKRFEARNGSVICRQLLDVDLQSGDRGAIVEKVMSVCPKMVSDAAEIVEELLFNEAEAK